MPSERIPSYYWDACVFLSLLEGHPDRIDVIEEFIHRAKAGKINICTSTLSITEVAFTATKRKGKVLIAKEEKAIDALWDPVGSPITVIEFHRTQATEARGLIRTARGKNWSLKPNDAVHVAAALEVRCDAFHTYDEKLYRLDAIAPLTIERPEAPVLKFGGTTTK